MALAIVHTRALAGVEAPAVAVEVLPGGGLPGLYIVGLPEAAVRESRDRVRGAIVNSGLRMPRRRIIINLAPADLPKGGGRYDLPIALGILAASGQIPCAALESCEFLGELGLSGELRPVAGVLPAALQTRAARRALILPHANAEEATLAHGIEALPAHTLLEVCGHLTGAATLAAHRPQKRLAAAPVAEDLADVRGQHLARRALEVSAAGGHNLLMLGPPGSGKTMLATRLPGILPPLAEEEALESAAIRSVSQCGFDLRGWGLRPFRAPHHTSSAVALVGGGSNPRPGEISLAHCGVLFLDELPEFDRRVLEALREPLESGRVVISRAARQAEFPARFQLVAAMNPCPCGYLGDASGRCRCTPDQIQRYRGRISGPLLDRIDLHVEVPRPTREMLLAPDAAAVESSAQVRERVLQARARQMRRLQKPNHQLAVRELEEVCALGQAERALLGRAVHRLRLSARACHRILRVARTIADLAGQERLAAAHLAEAVSYRRLDREAS